MDNSFSAKLEQLEKQHLAEMVNVTTYWLATRQSTFPYPLSERGDRRDISEDEFTAKMSLVWKELFSGLSQALLIS